MVLLQGGDGKAVNRSAHILFSAAATVTTNIPRRSKFPHGNSRRNVWHFTFPSRANYLWWFLETKTTRRWFSFVGKMTKSSFPTVKSLTRSHVVARCASPTPNNSPDEHKYLQVKSQPGWCHRVCTWTSSSSSLCLRLLYRNMSRLLRASPDQTAVTAGSWCGGPSAVHHCTPQNAPNLGRLELWVHAGIKV